MSSKKLFAFVLLVGCLLCSVARATAQSSGLLDGETSQTNPKSRPENMTLTISDTVAPSVPVLISPSNGSILATTTPSFVWEESTDNFSMSYYRFVRDGAVLFDNVPLTATSNSSYTLTKSGTQYTLVPAVGFADGTYTWKINAVDINGNSAESTSWSFTIATTTPTVTPVPGTNPTTAPTSTPSESASGEVTSAPSPTSTPVATPTPALTTIGSTITEAISQIPQTVIKAAENTAPVATALISSAVPIATTAIFASQFGWGISFQIVLRILQAIGILPPPSPQGMVFNSETDEPVAFAILNIIEIGKLNTSETVVTNTEGVYGGVQLPPGRYKIEVRHQDFVFPTAKTRPTYLSMNEFYKDEVFDVANEKTKQLFLIPVDPIQKIKSIQPKISWNLIRERVIRLYRYLLIPLFLLSAVITAFYPTIVNMSVCGIYVIIIASRLVGWFKKPMIVGKVVDTAGAPLTNVFVRIFDQQTNQLMSVLVTDQKGSFKAFLPKNEYQVSINKQKYVCVENDKVQVYYVADARKAKVVILAVMEDASKLYKDLFN